MNKYRINLRQTSKETNRKDVEERKIQKTRRIEFKKKDIHLINK